MKKPAKPLPEYRVKQALDRATAKLRAARDQRDCRSAWRLFREGLRYYVVGTAAYYKHYPDWSDPKIQTSGVYHALLRSLQSADVAAADVAVDLRRNGCPIPGADGEYPSSLRRNLEQETRKPNVPLILQRRKKRLKSR